MNIQRFSRKKFLFFIFMVFLGFTSACAGGVASNPASNSSDKKVIRIAIVTQDQVINTGTGGSIVREQKLLEKYLPKTVKYQNADYKLE